MRTEPTRADLTDVCISLKLQNFNISIISEYERNLFGITSSHHIPWGLKQGESLKTPALPEGMQGNSTVTHPMLKNQYRDVESGIMLMDAAGERLLYLDGVAIFTTFSANETLALKRTWP